jgi:hypothetical protein
MRFLNKTWVRVLVSLIAGGFTAEIIHITTGDPNRPKTTNLTLLYAIIIFAILTYFRERMSTETVQNYIRHE